MCKPIAPRGTITSGFVKIQTGHRKRKQEEPSVQWMREQKKNMVVRFHLIRIISGSFVLSITILQLLFLLSFPLFSPFEFIEKKTRYVETRFVLHIFDTLFVGF